MRLRRRRERLADACASRCARCAAACAASRSSSPASRSASRRSRASARSPAASATGSRAKAASSSAATCRSRSASARRATRSARSSNGSGRLSVAATMRAMARAASGETALVEIKAVDAAYPLFGSVTLEPAGDLAAALAQRDGVYRRRRRSGAAGAARSRARRAHHGRQRDHRAARDAQERARQARRRHRLRPAPADQRGGAARDRPGAARQPGALALPAARAGRRRQRPRRAMRWSRPREAQLPDAGWEVRTRANASPALGRNIERFTQYLTLVGLTALLVGGVGVANAVKHYLDRRREVIATLKSLGATGARVFAIYLTEVMLLAAIGTAIGLAIGAILPFAIAGAFGGVMPLPIEPALHARRAVLRGGLRLPHRAGLRALAARPRPRRAGLGAVSRRGRARAPPAAPALHRADRARGRDARRDRGPARLRPQDRRDLRRGSGRRVRHAAPRRRPASCWSRAASRARATRCCGSCSPTSTGRAR